MVPGIKSLRGRDVSKSPGHQKLEIAAFVGAEDLLGEQFGVAAFRLCGRRRRCGGALFQFSVVDQEFDAALFD